MLFEISTYKINIEAYLSNNFIKILKQVFKMFVFNEYYSIESAP